MSSESVLRRSPSPARGRGRGEGDPDSGRTLQHPHLTSPLQGEEPVARTRLRAARSLPVVGREAAGAARRPHIIRAGVGRARRARAHNDLDANLSLSRSRERAGERTLSPFPARGRGRGRGPYLPLPLAGEGGGEDLISLSRSRERAGERTLSPSPARGRGRGEGDPDSGQTLQHPHLTSPLQGEEPVARAKTAGRAVVAGCLARSRRRGAPAPHHPGRCGARPPGARSVPRDSV